MPRTIRHQNYQIEKAAPPVSTFSFRSLLMLVRKKLLWHQFRLPRNSHKHLQQPSLFVTSVSFPLASSPTQEKTRFVS